jgi:hypothetical protein
MKCSTPECHGIAIRKFCGECGAKHRSAGLLASKKYKYHWTPAMDDQIRQAYELHLATRKKASIKDTLARRWGFPPYAVQQRASKLGLCRAKEKPWDERELALLEMHSWKSEERISQILRAAGFARSANAIHVKRVRQLGQRRRDYPFYSAHALGKLMGIDSHQVTRWIGTGMLRARKRGTKRGPHQGGDEWAIYPADVRAFIVGNPLGFDIRKVEQLWFMDLLTNREADTTRPGPRPGLAAAA